MIDKAAEDLILAAEEQNLEADNLLAAARRLETEARKLLDAVRVCFPQPAPAPVVKPVLWVPPANDWLH